MASKKFLVGPDSSLTHDGRHYAIGTPIELDEAEAVKKPYGTLTPATDKEYKAKIADTHKGNIEHANVRVEVARKHLATVQGERDAIMKAKDKEVEHAEMRVKDAERAVAEAESAKADAEGVLDPTDVSGPSLASKNRAVADERAEGAKGGKGK
jgi:hypothetical protein